MRVAALVLAVSGTAVAGPAQKPPPPPVRAVWTGVFDPGLPKHAPWTNTKLTPSAHAGKVKIFKPAAGGDAASGAVMIAHPLLGRVVAGKVDAGAVALTDFAYDERDGDDGVLIVAGDAPIAIVALAKADATAIKFVLQHDEALAGVKRALVGLELAGVDLDGDGKADAAATYGCTSWADGACQVRGQFFLVKRGARWFELE